MGNIFLKNFESLHKMIFPFLISGLVLQYKQDRDSEWGPTLEQCIFTSLFKAIFTESRSFWLPAKMTQTNYHLFFMGNSLNFY